MAEYCSAREIGIYGVQADAIASIAPVDQDAAIEAASDLIDSYLRAQFKLPLVAFGNDIKRAAAIISAYDLLSARGLNPADAGDDGLKARYDDVVRWLTAISKGTAVPQVTDSSSGAQSGVPSGGPRVSSNGSRGWQETTDSLGTAFTGRR